MFRVLPGLLVITAAIAFVAGSDARAQEGDERILFLRNTAGPPREAIWMVAPDGSDAEPLDVGLNYLYMAEVSADGKKIVFGGRAIHERGFIDGRPVDLHTANIDGSAVTKLPFDGQEHNATWSPDGTQLAFSDVGQERSTWDLFIANLDGSGRRLLVDSTGTADDPDWSPDGSRIAFWMTVDAPETPGSRPASGTEIFTINVDGTGLTKVTSDGYALSPDWSPDGTRIAFSSYRDKYSAVYTMNADGSALRPLLADHGCNAERTICLGEDSPDWSPDGTRIVFDRQGGGDIWYANADGTGLTQVTSGPESDIYPQWFATGPALAATPLARPSGTPPSASATPCVTAAPATVTANPPQPMSWPPTPPPSAASPWFTPEPPHETPASETPASPTVATPSPMSLPPSAEVRIDVPAPVSLPTSATPNSPTLTPTCPTVETAEDGGDGISPEATLAAAAALGALVVGPPLLAGGALALKAWRRAKPGQ